MKQVTLLSPNDQVIRTQITLTKKLKSEIEKHARNEGQSLSGYLRQSALRALKQDKRRTRDLKKLAHEVVGSVDLTKHPEWATRKKVVQWVKNIRKEW